MGMNRNEELQLLLVEQQLDDVLGIGRQEFAGDDAIDIVDAGLEESGQCPVFGNVKRCSDDTMECHIEGSVVQYLDWWSDGEDSRYERN